MLIIILKRTLEIEEEVCVCLIDGKKEYDRVNWTKLMQILKGTGIDWCGRRLICNLYMVQSVKVRVNQGESSVMIGRGVTEDVLPRKFSKSLETLK
jgi:hypothetical protein